MATTKIAGHDVPIDIGPKTIINFWVVSGSTEEYGPWEFWTAEVTAKSATGCCRPGADPGEPFRRAEMLTSDRAGWEIARRAARVRPATAREVMIWLNAHRDFSPATMPHQIRGKDVRIDGQHGNYSIIELP